MGLRCLIGHDFDPPQTTREREDRGGEVVITVREYKECSRCGHRRIVSENTEVKANPDAAVEEEPTTEEPSPTAGDESFEDVTAEEDDGIILEDDPEVVEERQRGQWPEVDEEDLDEVQHDPWPEAEGEDEGFAAEPSEGDGPAEDVTFRGGGLTPEKATTEYPPGPAEEADEEETVGSDTPAGIRSAGPSRRAANPVDSSSRASRRCSSVRNVGTPNRRLVRRFARAISVPSAGGATSPNNRASRTKLVNRSRGYWRP